MMEQAFFEYLDQLYWEGYGEAFKDENPTEFQRQLTAFVCEHSDKGWTTDNKQDGLTKSKKRKNGTRY